MIDCWSVSRAKRVVFLLVLRENYIYLDLIYKNVQTNIYLLPNYL